MTVYPLIKENIILENYKGFDISILASIDETGRVYEHFTIYDHLTGDMMTGFDTLQKCVEWVKI